MGESVGFVREGFKIKASISPAFFLFPFFRFGAFWSALFCGFGARFCCFGEFLEDRKRFGGVGELILGISFECFLDDSQHFGGRFLGGSRAVLGAVFEG